MPEPDAGTNCAQCGCMGAPVWVHLAQMIYCWPCASVIMRKGPDPTPGHPAPLAASPETVAFVDQSLLKRIRKLEVQVERLKPPTNDMVTVCASCLQASCWQGVFYCEDYKHADITQKSIAELTALGLEDPSYWQEG